MRNLKIILALVFMAAISINAQTSQFDASEFITENKKSDQIQSSEGSYEFELSDQNTSQIFNSNKNHIIINNFPIRADYKVNLVLSKQASSITQDAKISYFKDGKKVAYDRKSKNSYYGFIEGQETSDIFISYNSLGLSGYLQDETGQMYDINGKFNELQNEFITHAVTETTMEDMVDGVPVLQCANDLLEEEYSPSKKDLLEIKKGSEIQKTPLLEVNMAADGSFEYYLMFAQFITGGNKANWEGWFDDMTAAQHEQALERSLDYIDLIMSAVSRIYIRELSILVKTPYITMFNDPFEDPYFDLFGQGLGDKLNAMPDIWATRTNEATDRVLATVFTDVSRQPAGSRAAGIAQSGDDNGGVICNKNRGYSALGTRGNAKFPALKYTGDVGTAAHEFGHNFGAPHTHSCFWQRQGLDLIDSCETGETFPNPNEQCLKPSDRRFKLNSTIMSYCHANGSIVLDFHPRLKKRIREHAEEALKFCIKEPTEPVVRLIVPLGEEVYFAGDEVNILFNSTNVPQAKLFYSDNLGKDWTEIGTVNTAVDTSFKWILPIVSNTENMIRIESSTNSDVFDQSIVPFIITDFSIAPDFPKPNDKVGYLTEQTLTWVKKNVSTVNVKLSLDNGKTFNDVASGNISSIKYNFPDVATSEAILLIESQEDSQVNVEIPFELGKENVAFNSPMMNDTINVNRLEHKIEFGMNFILEEFDILFRKNQTGEWAPLTNFAKKVDLENNEFVWTFSNDIQAGDLGELRAEIKNSEEIIGESGVFKFEAFTGVNLSYSTSFSINSITPNPADNTFQLVISNAEERLVNTNLRIIGVDGKEYINFRIGYISTGKTPQEIDVHDLPVGTYYLMIESDKYKDVQQLIIVR